MLNIEVFAVCYPETNVFSVRCNGGLKMGVEKRADTICREIMVAGHVREEVTPST